MLWTKPKLVMVTVAVLALCAACSAPSVGAESAPEAGLKLPNVFSDNMVLQRDTAVPVWGSAATGSEVTVKVTGQEVKGKANEKGQWSVKLAAMPAGGPHEMTVAGGTTMTFKNVMVGEVWFCSGQSNMEFPLPGAVTAGKALADVDKHSNLRLLNVRNGPEVSWAVCNRDSAKRFSAVAFFFGREIEEELKVPVGLIASPVGGTGIETWTPAFGYEGIDGLGRAINGKCYLERVQPFVPYAIRGAIWYQGEANTSQGKPDEGVLYSRKMQALVAGWRKVWAQGEFPFYYVQLPPYAYTKFRKSCETMPFALPLVWEAQARAQSIPNTGMAVTIDVGDPKDVHPRRKEEVGHRLALLALARTYGRKNLVCSGPVYKSMAVEGNKVRLKFEGVGGGLASRDGKPLDFFEIAGEDRKFVPAGAEIDGDSVVVSADGVARPAAVRYGWVETASPNLINKEGLPAAPFRTDNW